MSVTDSFIGCHENQEVTKSLFVGHLSLNSDDFWEYFVDVADVALALVYSHLLTPELSYALYKLLFVLRLMYVT